MRQEVVEAEGHLIDSHLMEQIFDMMVEFNGKFEVEEFAGTRRTWWESDTNRKSA